MKTLIIYDTTGRVILIQSGSYTVPQGIPYVEVDSDTLTGKIVVSVDVANKALITKDAPKSEQEMTLEQFEKMVPILVKNDLAHNKYFKNINDRIDSFTTSLNRLNADVDVLKKGSGANA